MCLLATIIIQMTAQKVTTLFVTRGLGAKKSPDLSVWGGRVGCFCLTYMGLFAKISLYAIVVDYAQVHVGCGGPTDHKAPRR